MRLTKSILALMLIAAMPACGSNSPAAPQGPPPAVTPVIAMFTDASTGFSTSDVRDVQEQIVRFDSANSALIWVADGRRFPGYPVDGNVIGPVKNFQVRFGMKDGERRAYFTETATGTICDIVVSGGALTILPTNVTVPGT
jgi:hypothetical protein